VTDRRLAEDRIRHLANFDTLTGLPNRRQLIWRAERALDRRAGSATQGRAAADRPRPLQGHQRHLWATAPATSC
jgi:GGDEF domain-containing protein